MRYLIISLTILMFSCRSSSTEKAPIKKYDFKFEQYNPNDRNIELEKCVGSFTQYRFLKGLLKNNSYDTISIYLYKTNCKSLFYIRPDMVRSAIHGKDSIHAGVDVIYTEHADTIVKLSRGMLFDFLLPISKSEFNSETKNYFFSTTIDSAGTSKEVKLSYSGQW
jgi:hypothetical protein